MISVRTKSPGCEGVIFTSTPAATMVILQIRPRACPPRRRHVLPPLARERQWYAGLWQSPPCVCRSYHHPQWDLDPRGNPSLAELHAKATPSPPDVHQATPSSRACSPWRRAEGGVILGVANLSPASSPTVPREAALGRWGAGPSRVAASSNPCQRRFGTSVDLGGCHRHYVRSEQAGGAG